MLFENKLVGFVLTKDSAAARAFYETTLGLQFIKDDGFALVFQSGDNMIRIAKVQDFTPLPSTVLGWEVSSVEDAYDSLQSNGVVFDKYPWVSDPRGIWNAPDGSVVAWFKDPDGNVLSISRHA